MSKIFLQSDAILMPKRHNRRIILIAAKYPIGLQYVMSHNRGWVGSFEFVTECDRGGWLSEDD